MAETTIQARGAALEVWLGVSTVEEVPEGKRGLGWIRFHFNFLEESWGKSFPCHLAASSQGALKPLPRAFCFDYGMRSRGLA